MRARIQVATLVLVTACGGGPLVGSGETSTTNPPVTTSSTATTTTSTPPLPSDRPPDLRVAAGDEELTLAPFTYCWSGDGQGVCADGIPPDPLPSIRVEQGVGLSMLFPLDWSFQATLLPSADPCDEAWVVDVDPDGTPVHALGREGTTRVDVFGRGDRGDGAWAFEIAITADRSVPPPFVQAFWYPAGDKLDPAAGFSAVIGNLARTANDPAVSLKVTAANGASRDIPASMSGGPDCPGPGVYLEAPSDLSRQARDLGPAPYDVVVVLTSTWGTITSDPVRWPDDFPANGNESRRVRVTVDIG